MTEGQWFDWNRSHPAGAKDDDGNTVAHACFTDPDSGKTVLFTITGTGPGAFTVEANTDLPVVITGTFVGPEMPS